MPDPTVTTPPSLPPLADLLEDQVVGLESALLDVRRDVEGVVHEARVALRRLRSSLTVYSLLLVAEVAEPLRSELSWLARRLGPARDAQVMFIRIGEAVAEVEQDEADAAEVLQHFETAQDEAFATAREALDSERFVALVGRLDVARLRGLVATDAPAGYAADRMLTRLVRDLQTAEGATDEHLHDLRKAVKRARYVRGEEDDVDGALKKLQGVLGEHQDSVVARERLAELPDSALVRRLIEREATLAAESEARVGKAVRKLSKAVSRP